MPRFSWWVLSIMASGLALAQGAPPAGPVTAKDIAAAQAFIKGLDKNGDGVLDRSETKGFPLDADFDKIDANHDGKIDAKELAAFKATMPAGARQPPPAGGTPPGK